MELLKTIKVNEVVDNLTGSVMDGTINPLEAIVRLKKLEEIVKLAKVRISGAVIDEAAKYGKTFTYLDAEITNKSSAGRYDYSNIPEIVAKEIELKAIKDKHKAALKVDVIDLDTGELIAAPIYKGGKEIISIKLNKMAYLVNIQNELKAPKNEYNSFGKYNYRSAEGILEALKPLLLKYGCYLTITEKTEEKAGYLVLTSKATISDGENSIFVEAEAGINPERKGMDIAQSFGSSSSYAKKYALGNLFLLDDTKDADSNKVNEPAAKIKPKMSTDIYNAMLEYINTGKSAAVSSKMSNYNMSKKQEDTLTRMIKENTK